MRDIQTIIRLRSDEVVDALARRAHGYPTAMGLERNELIGTWWELLDAIAARCATNDAAHAKARCERLIDTHLALRRRLGFSLEQICDEIAFVSRELSSSWLTDGPESEPRFEHTRIFFHSLEHAMERSGRAFYGDLAARRRQERQTLRRLDQALAAAAARDENIELGELLCGPLEVICEALSADGGAIHLLENDRDLRLAIVTGAVTATDAGNRIRLGGPGFVNEVARTDDILQLSDATAAATREFGASTPPLRTMIAARLWPNGKLLGVLTLARTRIEPFAPTARQLLDLLSEYLATIIDRLRLAREVRAANERLSRQHELEREERKRREFIEYLIGVASHDLRNPLTSVLMSATALLKREDLDYRVQAQLMRVVTSTRRASRLIRDLLDFTSARMGAGVPLERRNTELGALLGGVAEEIRSAYPDRTVRIDAPEEVRGFWDPDRLAQVFINLITNALQYSSADTPVTVRIGSEGDAARVSVHNGGSVIPQAQLETIFAPLKRGGDNGRDRFGLGLFIVQAIAAAHGGEVSVRSSSEEGTTFTVTLPRQAEAESAVQLDGGNGLGAD